MKTECAGHAELTSHLTPCLRGHAERRSVLFGNIYRFDELFAYLKQVFPCTVRTDGLFDRGMPTDGIVRLEGFAPFEGDIRHLFKGCDTTDVEPLRELFPRELLQAAAQRHLLQFRQCLS